MQLDPRSIISMAAMLSALMALVIWLMRQTYPAAMRPALSAWALSPLLWLLASVCFGLPEWVTPTASVILGNLFLMLGGISWHHGVRVFHGQPPALGGWLLSAALALGAVVYFVIVMPSYTPRLLIMATWMAALFGGVLLVLYRHARASFPSWMMGVVLLVFVAVMMLRVGSGLLGMAGSHLLQHSLIQSIYLSAYVMAALMLSLSSVLLANDTLRLELERLARLDGLTQLLNHRATFEACEAELLRSRRSGIGPSLVMLDVDHFKAINDTQGHLHGDAVLRNLAVQAQAVMRKSDVLGRVGGEEFLLLLPYTQVEGALTVTEHLRNALAQDETLGCRFSAGVTAWRGGDDTLDAMLTRADAALYQAKREGRNRTCVQ